MSYENVNATPNFQRQALGQKGLRVLGAAGTGQAGEFYRAITVTDDAVLNLTAESGDNLVAVAIAAGITVYGLFSAVTVVSGKALAYIA